MTLRPFWPSQATPSACYSGIRRRLLQIQVSSLDLQTTWVTIITLRLYSFVDLLHCRDVQILSRPKAPVFPVSIHVRHVFRVAGGVLYVSRSNAVAVTCADNFEDRRATLKKKTPPIERMSKNRSNTPTTLPNLRMQGTTTGAQSIQMPNIKRVDQQQSTVAIPKISKFEALCLCKC